ncbi:MAG TPA: tyrosine-type recombinase/integrase [Fervidobacterium sp.]|nr:tyrosine-type recombinase/integrase [Fervidobacterium sp.]HOM74030.1 tyrosine-type recombinase/integrase [Fervidobacterium sp.]HOQ38926.1 tyrosine-type recombinase/integrase [Fervidobacterium sp.]HPP17753.1 tyrosine-type recombinase/integrase [Fervidobacterium sp.]HPT53522.1 tyrosine-type recombinase/integrase [Fervidobacterium sp.]
MIDIQITRILRTFEDYLVHVRRSSDNTVKAYMKDIRRFFEYVQKNPNDITRDDVEGFLKALSKGEITHGSVTETTISRYISSLRVFFDYMTLIGAVKENPVDRIRHPRLRKKIPSFLTIEEVREIINAYNEEKELKYRTIVATLYFCGLRVSELCNLKVEDVSFYPAYVKVVMGKGNKDRLVPISDNIVPLLEKYEKEYKPKVYFFENTGRSLAPSTVFRIVKRAAKKAGITKDIHPHTLRHSFATHLIMNNVNVKIVQELLGHSNLSTTSIYLHVADKEKFDAVKRLVI